MSIPVEMEITCPRCKRSFQTIVFQSVNTELRKDLPEQIISGKFFEETCPRCGFVAHLEYNVLYNDLKHQAMIWLVSPNSPTYENELNEVRKTLQTMHKYVEKLRIVNDTTALREKVACLESGRDDRIIELYKFALEYDLAQQKQGQRVDRSFYTYSNGKELIYFYTFSGQEYHVELPEDGYRIIEKQYGPEIDEYVYDLAPVIDRAWVHHFLSHTSLDEEYESDCLADEVAPPEICFCRKCGNKLLPDSEFCSYCGTRVIR